MSSLSAPADVREEDRLRADLYDFLAVLLARAPDGEMIARCQSLSGDESDLGKAIGALQRVAASASEEAVQREYNRLFIGLGRGELVPYASFYLTGFLNEKPLAHLREDMAALGIQRAQDVHEPEDNIASLCEMMAALIDGRFGQPASLNRQKEFFDRHIASWAPHFFADLKGAKSSLFYAPVGEIGQIFMAIEKEAFRMAGDSPS